jgi:hypothetical protein
MTRRKNKPLTSTTHHREGVAVATAGIGEEAAARVPCRSLAAATARATKKSPAKIEPKPVSKVQASAKAAAKPVGSTGDVPHDDLRRQLSEAEARIVELEARLAGVTDRIAWIADRLHGLLHDDE